MQFLTRNVKNVCAIIRNFLGPVSGYRKDRIRRQVNFKFIIHKGKGRQGSKIMRKEKKRRVKGKKKGKGTDDSERKEKIERNKGKLGGTILSYKPVFRKGYYTLNLCLGKDTIL